MSSLEKLATRYQRTSGSSTRTPGARAAGGAAGCERLLHSLEARLECCRVRKVEPSSAPSRLLGLDHRRAPRAVTGPCPRPGAGVGHGARTVQNRSAPRLDGSRGMAVHRARRLPYNRLHDRQFRASAVLRAPARFSLVSAAVPAAGGGSKPESRECGLHSESASPRPCGLSWGGMTISGVFCASTPGRSCGGGRSGGAAQGAVAAQAGAHVTVVAPQLHELGQRVARGELTQCRRGIFLRTVAHAVRSSRDGRSHGQRRGRRRASERRVPVNVVDDRSCRAHLSAIIDRSPIVSR